MVALAYTTKSESITVTSTSAGASADVLYTCPPNHDATLDMLYVTNGGNSTSKIYVEFYHADDTSYHKLVNGKSLAGHDTYNILSSSNMHLHAGDKIVVYKESGTTFDITISAREFFNPNRIA